MIMTKQKDDSVGRKKRAVPGRTTKIDGPILDKAELLARKAGLTTGDYLSRILKPIIDREFSKLVRKTAEGGEE